MDIANHLIDIILHLDVFMGELVNTLGIYSYLLIFAVIFCETGLVITPFLPGDSLIFVIGTLSAMGMLDTITSIVVLVLAAILGDTVNYHIGKLLGPKMFHTNSKYLKKEYVIKAHKFYEKHGGVTIIIARFIPIIRTFAPFVAGIGTMPYKNFLFFNVIGAFMWVFTAFFMGYLFGNIPFIKDNFSIFIVAVVVVSALPMVYHWIKEKN
ncbi:MAG: DedA family protein [Methanobacteriaceae archaeon]